LGKKSKLILPSEEKSRRSVSCIVGLKTEVISLSWCRQERKEYHHHDQTEGGEYHRYVGEENVNVTIMGR
jgi:hypothetical protein